MNKKAEKRIDEIIALSHVILDAPMERSFLVERYKQFSANNGEQSALDALERHLKDFRKKKRDIENRKWATVKNELLSLKGSTPTSTRVLKEMIKNGEIDVTGIPSYEWVMSVV